MNKKIILPILLLLMIGIVSATLITHYGQAIITIEVEQPIVLDGELAQTITGFSGQTILGGKITATNNAPFDVDVQIISDVECEEFDDRDDCVEVSYTGTLELTKKTEQPTTPWPATGDPISVTYTVIGDTFYATVAEEDVLPGYSLIYYSEREPRETGMGIVTVIGSEGITGELPEADDDNKDVYDMCVIEGYDACHGAKIWYVPTTDLTGDNLNWASMANYYWETELVQFSPNDNIITIYPDQVLSLYPQFKISLVFSGTATITTNVDPVLE